MTLIDRRTSIDSLSDTALLSEVRRLAACERQATLDVILALMALDERRLYLAEGFSSLFTYCTQVLHFSEHAAYGRIEAARAARRVPAILSLLEEGALTLTAVGLLAPHLTLENHQELLASARHKSKREIEQIVAAIRPHPPAPTVVRSVPTHAPQQSPGSSTAMVAPVQKSEASSRVQEPSQPVRKPPVVAALSPETYRVQVTISGPAHDHLRRAQELLRHTIPNGDAAQVIERALALLVDHLERTRMASVRHPRPQPTRGPSSRHVPAAVKREVWARDGGQCAFVGTKGRCAERCFLELHHVIPFAEGGPTDAANLQLRCRAHNAYEAEQWFGAQHSHPHQSVRFEDKIS